MFYIDDHIDQLDLAAALPLLPEARRTKALRFKHESGRRQSVAAWLQLQRGCLEVFGLEQLPDVAYSHRGKPFFPSRPDIHFNLSHCREAVACVVDHRPVGIDVERVRPFSDRLARHVLSGAEYDRVVAADHPALAFTRLWTMKESLLKLTGEGLADSGLPSLLEDRPGYRFETVVGPDARYVCTVCYEKS